VGLASPEGPNPARLARLGAAVKTYQDAAANLASTARPARALSPEVFLRRAAARHHPERAIAAWTAHAVRRGLSTEQIGSLLSLQAARYARAVPHLLSAAVVYPLARTSRWAASAAIRQVPPLVVLRHAFAVARTVSAVLRAPVLIPQAAYTVFTSVLRQVVHQARSADRSR
jgi:hypothetical protein